MANEAVRELNMEIALQIAFELFLKNGGKNTTKEMVVRESHLSRSSNDRYFASKIECVLSVVKWADQNIWDKYVPLQSFLLDRYLSGAYVLRRYIQAVSALLYENPKLFVLGIESRAFIYRNASQN